MEVCGTSGEDWLYPTDRKEAVSWSFSRRGYIKKGLVGHSPLSHRFSSHNCPSQAFPAETQALSRESTFSKGPPPCSQHPRA